MHFVFLKRENTANCVVVMLFSLFAMGTIHEGSFDLAKTPIHTRAKKLKIAIHCLSSPCWSSTRHTKFATKRSIFSICKKIEPLFANVVTIFRVETKSFPMFSHGPILLAVDVRSK